MRYPNEHCLKILNILADNGYIIVQHYGQYIQIKSKSSRIIQLYSIKDIIRSKRFGHKSTIKYEELIKYVRREGLAFGLLNTHLGVLTFYEAIRLRTGGHFILLIN